MDLKKERNAVILAHNYQLPEVQDIADFVGDSLGLSVQASKTEADVDHILWCRLHGRERQILNPGKKVILPESRAKCPMAQMCDVHGLKLLKEDFPRAAVVAYVNDFAD